MPTSKLEPWRLEKADEEVWEAMLSYVRATEDLTKLKEEFHDRAPTEGDRLRLRQALRKRVEARMEVQAGRARAAMGKVFDDLFPDENPK
jgi:hypothetical protein